MRYLYRFLSVIEREVSPRDWAIGIALGTWLGWQVGLNLQTLVCLLTMAFVRGNPLGLFFGVLFGFLCQDLSSAFCQDVGYWILTHGASFRRVWAGIYHAPLIPYTFFYETRTMGRLVLGSANTCLFFIVTFFLAKRYGREIFSEIADGALGLAWQHTVLRHRYVLYISQYGMPASATSLIRTRAALFAVVTFMVAVVGVFASSSFLLHTAASRYLTVINGAPVTIGNLQISWTTGELELTDIAVTHHTQMARNIFQIDSIKAKFELAPLLKKKAILPKVEISGIQMDVPKNSIEEGTYVEYVDPKVPNFLDRVATHFFAEARRDVKENPFRSLVALQKGLDLSAYLRHEKRTLASDKEATLISIAADSIRSSCLAAKSAADLRECKGRWDELQARYKALDSLVAKDIEQLKDGLGLSHLKVQDLSTPLLGPRILQWLERFGYWMDFSRRRMGKSVDLRVYTLVVEDGPKGKLVHFGKRSTQPSLAILEVHVTSRKRPNTNYGDVEGIITGLTNSPAVYGKPVDGKFAFAFPENGYKLARVNLKINHTGAQNREFFHVTMEEFPLRSWAFFQSSDLFLGLKKAKASFNVEFESRESHLNIKGSLRVHSLQYEIRSPYNQLQVQLGNVFSAHTEIPIEFQMTGLPEEGNLTITSPFGIKIATSLREEFKQAQAAVADSLKNEIDDNLAPTRRSIQSRLTQSFDTFIESSRKTASIK